MVIAITRSGYIKRLPVTTYREQRRGGIGVMGMDMKDDDYIEHLFVASTHDYILFFTSVGKVYRLKVHELPLGSRQSKGRAIVNLLPFRQDELVRAVIATRDYKESKYLVFATQEGRDQEDRVPRVQHAAQGRRDHRAEDARGRRADRRPALRRRRRHPDGLAPRPGRPLPRERRARDGPPRLRRRGHEAPRRRRGDRGRHRLRRRRPARRDRERLGQAHARLRVPAQGPRHDGRQDGPARRGQGPPRRRPDRPRGLPGDADLRRRHRDPDGGRRDQALGPLDAGRDRDAAARGRARLDAGAGRRIGRRRRRAREDDLGRSGGRSARAIGARGGAARRRRRDRACRGRRDEE